MRFFVQTTYRKRKRYATFGVFVPVIDNSFIGKSLEVGQCFMHLRSISFEEATTPGLEECVTSENTLLFRVILVRDVKTNRVLGMTRCSKTPDVNVLANRELVAVLDVVCQRRYGIRAAVNWHSRILGDLYVVNECRYISIHVLRHTNACPISKQTSVTMHTDLKSQLRTSLPPE
jgi:hypothetical protein